MNILKIGVLLALAILVVACSESNVSIDEAEKTGGVAIFNPGEGEIPFPNTLLISSPDGTIDIPDPNAVQVALNGLDGFSTIAPLTTRFSARLDPGALIGGHTIRLFEVTSDPQTGKVTGLVSELRSGIDYLVGVSPAVADDPADADGTTLMITLLRPLKPKKVYLVALSDGIRFAEGGKAISDISYQIAQGPTPLIVNGKSQLPGVSDPAAATLEPIRQMTNAQERVLARAGIAKRSLVLSWSFKTQSITEVIEKVFKKVQEAAPATSTLADSGVDSPLGAADIFTGTLLVPYYLAAPSRVNDTAPLTQAWEAVATVAGERNLTALNPEPELKSSENIPLMVSVPKDSKPAGGWPTVLYQHGITTNRTTLLAMADVLASAGFAAVAIDLPLHGITGNETDGTQSFYVAYDPVSHTGERTFDLDLATGTTPGTPDGVTDPSGTHFINLQSLLTSRDNLRQAVADLLTLVRALETMDYDGGGSDFDTTQLRFLGHSLGGIVGAVFLALKPDVGAATLAMPGGGIAKLLDGSVRYGPLIAAGLAAANPPIIKGFEAYEGFTTAAQTVIDAADPLNYVTATVNQRGVLSIEVVGGNTSPPDQVIPNNVLTQAPPGTVPGLGGTEPLTELMGSRVVKQTTVGSQLNVVLHYSAGHHGSIATPNDALGNPDPVSAAVNKEMQTQMAAFFSSNGEHVLISDPTLLKE